MDKKFIINERFSVDPTLNLLEDKETGKVQRLEPRLIKLLCMLIKQEGELVEREKFISEIWKDYYGAEDSLNQSISFLRKALQDTKRDLIETVPKKGYILHANITKDEMEQTIVGKRRRFKLKYGVSIAVAVMVVLPGGYFIWKYKTKESQGELHQGVKTPSSADTKQTMEVNFSDLDHPEEENASNTITTTDSNGTKYRLVAIGDQRPKFYVNGQLVSGPELEKYSELESQMLRQLWDRLKKH